MKKPRDLDAELQALQQRAKALKGKRVTQFGELVIATGADRLDMEVLAGALITAAKADGAALESWRRLGAGFFQGQAGAAPTPPDSGQRSAPDGGGASPG